MCPSFLIDQTNKVDQIEQTTKGPVEVIAEQTILLIWEVSLYFSIGVEHALTGLRI